MGVTERNLAEGVMSGIMKIGDSVAVVLVDPGSTLATATIVKMNDKESRTETPYEQLERHELARRHWRIVRAYRPRTVGSGFRCAAPRRVIRLATEADKAETSRCVEVRRARERMPQQLRNREEYERQIKLAEDALRRQREPYERLLRQIGADEALLREDAAYKIVRSMCADPAWQEPDDDANWLAEMRRQGPDMPFVADDLHAAQRRLIAEGREGARRGGAGEASHPR